jgi:prepilin-type N-terminal cleavage/methylation domain-containing protein
MRQRKYNAFTLIELLTVIAISGILITLIIIPLVQGFNLTRQGAALADAQDRARLIIGKIAKEIGNATGVRDNTGYRGAITVVVPGKPDINGKQPDIPVTLQYAKCDIVKPAEGDPTRGASGAFINPNTGKEDPTQAAPKGQIVLPLAPGATIVRYWIALRDPITANGGPAKYENPYDGILMSKAAVRDNLFSLYRAEIQPYVYTDAGPRVNLALFQDVDGDDVPDDIDDPAFFTLLPTADYSTTTGVLTAAGQAKVKKMNYWLGDGIANIPDPNYPGDPGHIIKCPLGRAAIVTELQRFDMIQPQYDLRTRQVQYDNITDYTEPSTAAFRPRLIPLAQFKPTRISSDPAEGEEAIRLGEETENATDIAPDVFTTKYGGWTSAVIRTWTSDWDHADPNFNDYEVGRSDPRNGQTGYAPGFSIYWFDPDSGGEETLDGKEMFDVQAYQNGVSLGGATYPFSAAIQQANLRSSWLTDVNAAKMRSVFTPYFPDTTRGKLVGSFDISQVGLIGTPPPPADPNNLPSALAGAGSPLTEPRPASDSEVYSPADPAASSAPSGAYAINGCFNKVWNLYDGSDSSHPNLRPDIQRFIDLRLTPQGDSTTSTMTPTDPSPLNPDPTIGFERARIVPGSEEVYGPDQTPGENFGRNIRYLRVVQNPGPNQYKINYVNLTEPDYSIAYPGLPALPAGGVYDPTNITSAVIQPRFKAGYIQLNSDANAPIPAGEFQVFYKFQFTHPSDAFAVDYDSRPVMSINLTIRTFPQSSFPNAQSVSVKTSATVRNFIR